jgi:hypothetical protein
MPQLTENAELADAIASDEGRHAKSRQILSACLTDIAEEVTAALTNAGITIPVFMSIPSSGRAVLSYMTPDDPDDDVWQEVGEIIGDIVAERIGIDLLNAEPLVCASACPERPA